LHYRARPSRFSVQLHIQYRDAFTVHLRPRSVGGEQLPGNITGRIRYLIWISFSQPKSFLAWIQQNRTGAHYLEFRHAGGNDVSVQIDGLCPKQLLSLDNSLTSGNYSLHSCYKTFYV
jgi:hypothetical protein